MSEPSQIALDMLLVFGGAKLLGEIFERLRQPAIVGEILAGVLLGPTALNWVHWDVTLQQFAELGVMFLLFRVGLEVRSSELMKVGKTALLVAVLGVLLPFLFGWGIMRLWGENNVTSFFAASAMVATSVGITAQVLASKGLLHLESAKIILAAAVIDDVLGLLVLAVVSSMAKGDVNLVGLATTAVLAVGFTLVIAQWGTSAMQRIVPRVEATFKSSETQFSFAMITLFALALGASYAGVAAIVGAFLAGMALADSVNHRVHDLANGVTELLVPFFLAGIGIQLDWRSLADPATLILAVLILVAAVFSKLAGCGLGAWSLGKRAATQVGVGMVPRGEVGMVVAQIGIGLGVIPPHVYAVVVFMAIATTVVAPPLLAWAFREELPGEAVEQFHIG